MRVALVAPQWNKLVNSYPPLGLGYLAAVLEQQGQEVAIFDLGLDPQKSPDEAVEPILSFGPDVVGVTAMTNNYRSAQEMMALVHRDLDCPIVLGGPHATLFPEELVQEAATSYVVEGEGEATLSELVAAMERSDGQPSPDVLAGIAGLTWTRDGCVVRNRTRPLLTDLDALPFPSRRLFPLDRYGLSAPDGAPMATVLSSRGCPYCCSYCFKGIVGRTYRQRSPENVLRELDHLRGDHGYEHIYFVDDLFTFDRERLNAICDGLIASSMNLRWQCLARVDRVDMDILIKMQTAGCREIHYGIESGNPDILRRLGKGITMDQVREAVAATAGAGILAKGYFMLGLPGDTAETMQQTIDFAGELALDEAMFSLTTPFPGTRLWDELLRRDPAVVQNLDLERAFYYVGDEEGLAPLLNLSQVDDSELVRIVTRAQESFQEAKRRRKYVRALGSPLGRAVYSLSTNPTVRRLGHALLNSNVGRSLREGGRLADLGSYNMSEELSQRWT